MKGVRLGFNLFLSRAASFRFHRDEYQNMARKPRIDYPGAWHHVMNQGTTMR